jgi:hypothetical protein
MSIVQFNAKHGPGQDELHGSLQFDGLLFHGLINEGSPFFPAARPFEQLAAIAIAAAVTTTAAAATTTTTKTTAISSATRSFFTWAGNIDSDGAAIQICPVHGLDGFLGFLVRAHGHEGKTS